MIVLAALLGSAWRRWFGSARADWSYPGYRFTQIASGFAVLAMLQFVEGESLWRCALDSALAIGFMTLPISVSRQPFVWLMKKIDPPKMWGTMLNGPEPWAEALQGAVVWSAAVLI